MTELVAVDAPEPLASFIVERRYVGRGVPLLKRIAGLPGQRVCRTGRAITVDGVAMGEALERDRIGRDLPVWQGCRVIADGELFLMNGHVRDSLDGRYFGPIPASAVIGQALPLWTDEEGDGRYEWRAPNAVSARRAAHGASSTSSPPQQKETFHGAYWSIPADREAGFLGRIQTLVINADVVLIPAKKSDAENAPDFRIHIGDADGPEVGAAWKRTGEKAGEYLSVLLDDPALPQPIRANLFQNGDDKSSWSLHWSRPKQRDERD